MNTLILIIQRFSFVIRRSSLKNLKFSNKSMSFVERVGADVSVFQSSAYLDLNLKVVIFYLFNDKGIPAGTIRIHPIILKRKDFSRVTERVSPDGVVDKCSLHRYAGEGDGGADDERLLTPIHPCELVVLIISYSIIAPELPLYFDFRLTSICVPEHCEKIEVQAIPAIFFVDSGDEFNEGARATKHSVVQPHESELLPNGFDHVIARGKELPWPENVKLVLLKLQALVS